MRAAKLAMGFDPERHFAVDERVYEHMSLADAGAQATNASGGRGWTLARAAPRARGGLGARVGGPPARGLARGAAELRRPARSSPRAPRARRRWRPSPRTPPTMVGGAADLVESTKTVFPGAGHFSRVHAGRNVPFGIREHAMGAIVNGAAAHGGIVKPYGSTFLVFSDYMRGSVRLSALMGLPVVWVWTHDSVGLGEDGPTHQPVEHYAALRAIPHLWVVRPADANETVQAWRVALEREDGPVALLLSRQGIPVLDREDGKLAAASELERGGYVLWDSAPSPEVVLISTGAEVPTHPGGRARAGRGGHGGARRVDAVRGAVRSSDAGVPRHRAPARRHRAPGGRAGCEHELVEVGGHPRRRARHRPLRRLRARRAGARRSSASRLRTSPPAPARCSSGDRAPAPAPVRCLGGDAPARCYSGDRPRPPAAGDRTGAERVNRLAAPVPPLKWPRDRNDGYGSTLKRPAGKRPTPQGAADAIELPGNLPPLHRLSALGQSVWVDFLSRESIRGGHLQELLDADAVVGATSNPTIFQKAMSTGDAYDEQLRELAEEGLDARANFWRLAERDIKDACDLFHPIWEGGSGRDGYVSLEVAPDLAYDTLATYNEAMQPARDGGPPEPDGQDPRDPAGAGGDRGRDRARATRST